MPSGRLRDMHNDHPHCVSGQVSHVRVPYVGGVLVPRTAAELMLLALFIQRECMWKSRAIVTPAFDSFQMILINLSSIYSGGRPSRYIPPGV